MNCPTWNVVKTCWNSHIWASLYVVFRPARRAANFGLSLGKLPRATSARPMKSHSGLAQQEKDRAFLSLCPSYYGQWKITQSRLFEHVYIMFHIGLVIRSSKPSSLSTQFVRDMLYSHEPSVLHFVAQSTKNTRNISNTLCWHVVVYTGYLCMSKCIWNHLVFVFGCADALTLSQYVAFSTCRRCGWQKCRLRFLLQLHANVSSPLPPLDV